MDVPDPVIGEIASAIHVRHLQTSLSAARVFTPCSLVSEVAAHMKANKYDATPVFPPATGEGSSARTDPHGTLWFMDLHDLDPAEEVRPVVRPLGSSCLIDGNASVVRLLDRFRVDHRFMLVVGNQGLEGIVTPSDLNKQAGRTHMFMLVSALEMGLANRVRATDRKDSEILGMLPKDRARRASSLLARKQSRDVATDLVAALDFQDLLVIMRATASNELFTALSKEQIESLADFRNGVMHAVLEPAGDASDRLEHVLAQTAQLTRLLEALETGA